MATDGPKTMDYKRARFYTQLPLDSLYTPSHFWLGRQDDRTWRVGLTKFASRMLGEMVDYGFDVALDTPVVSGLRIGWVEGFKAVSDIFCVGNGRFAGPNPELESDLQLINRDPYGAGWLYAIHGEPDLTCMDVEAYAKILDQTIDRILEKG